MLQISTCSYFNVSIDTGNLSQAKDWVSLFRTDSPVSCSGYTWCQVQPVPDSLTGFDISW